MISIAIDGPAGAGKSTIARRAAKELGFLYVDTGALYRAVGLYVLRRGINPANVSAVCAALKDVDVKIIYEDGEQQVLLCGDDVTDMIRSADVSMMSSKVSAIPQVREYLFSLQQNIAKSNNIVMDGRDIGTVVLPQAQVKIFLTAATGERARRRYEEMLQKGMKADYQDVLKDIKQRDYNDTHRAISPLVAAKDAILVDTTGNTLEQSVENVVAIIKNRLDCK